MVRACNIKQESVGRKIALLNPLHSSIPFSDRIISHEGPKNLYEFLWLVSITTIEKTFSGTDLAMSEMKRASQS
jgi:hypothetical protein